MAQRAEVEQYLDKVCGFVLRISYGLAVLSGKMVLTSLPFPFLNYGGHVLIEYAALGLLMGIYRRKDIIPLFQTQGGLYK